MSKKTKKPRASRRNAAAETPSTSRASEATVTAESQQPNSAAAAGSVVPTSATGQSAPAPAATSVPPSSAQGPASFQSLIPSTDDIDDDWGQDEVATATKAPTSPSQRATTESAKSEPAKSAKSEPAKPELAEARVNVNPNPPLSERLGAARSLTPGQGVSAIRATAATGSLRPSTPPSRSLSPASGTPAVARPSSAPLRRPTPASGTPLPSRSDPPPAGNELQGRATPLHSSELPRSMSPATGTPSTRPPPPSSRTLTPLSGTPIAEGEPASRSQSGIPLRPSSPPARSLSPASGIPATRLSQPPEARKSVAPEARKSVAPEARKSVAPEARKSVAPEARKSVAPEARKSVAPEARSTASTDAARPSSVPRPSIDSSSTSPSPPVVRAFVLPPLLEVQSSVGRSEPESVPDLSPVLERDLVPLPAAAASAIIEPPAAPQLELSEVGAQSAPMLFAARVADSTSSPPPTPFQEMAEASAEPALSRPRSDAPSVPVAEAVSAVQTASDRSVDPARPVSPPKKRSPVSLAVLWLATAAIPAAAVWAVMRSQTRRAELEYHARTPPLAAQQSNEPQPSLKVNPQLSATVLSAPNAEEVPQAVPDAGAANADAPKVSASPSVAASAVASAGAAPQPSALPSGEVVVETDSKDRVSVLVRTRPDGARVLRRGKEIGRTPLTIQIGRGEHRIFEVSMVGFGAKRITLDGEKPEILVNMATDAKPTTITVPAASPAAPPAAPKYEPMR